MATSYTCTRIPSGGLAIWAIGHCPGAHPFRGPTPFPKHCEGPNNYRCPGAQSGASPPLHIPTYLPTYLPTYRERERHTHTDRKTETEKETARHKQTETNSIYCDICWEWWRTRVSDTISNPGSPPFPTNITVYGICLSLSVSCCFFLCLCLCVYVCGCVCVCVSLSLVSLSFSFCLSQFDGSHDPRILHYRTLFCRSDPGVHVHNPYIFIC